MDLLIDSSIGILIDLCPFLLVILGTGIGWRIITERPNAHAKALQKKIGSLGDLRGKTHTEIEAVVGPPTSCAEMDYNKMICSWKTQKYYIALIFNGEICEGVHHEISV